MSKQTNTIAGLRSNPILAFLIGLLVVALVFVAVAVVKIQMTNTQIQHFLKQTEDLRSADYRLVGSLRQAVAGNELSFEDAKETFVDMAQIWDELNGPTNKAVASSLTSQIASVSEIWDQRIKVNAATIYENKDTILLVNDVATRLGQTIPEIQQQYDDIVSAMIEAGAPADQIEHARSQSWRAERLGRNIDKIAAGSAEAGEAADQFNTDAAMFGKVLQGMREGDHALNISRVTNAAAVQALNDVAGLFKFVSESSDKIAKNKESLTRARQAADNLLEQDSGALLQELANLNETAGNLPEIKKWNFVFFASAGIAVFVMIAIAIILIRGGSRRLGLQEEENERNQTAIMRLLDELADLADGDLTATATVTEDFTGAIADSINFTIDQLRVLVSRINDTAVRVSSAAQETQGTALHLAEASDHQAQEIAGASAAVNEMAVTIDQVSANAAESAAVAERSVSIANKGAEVVQNTIQGMDNIREQIQETSKRIKRLGESSQEIGDIVSLINDIADQTNILALNAAIQASMAGDAGRGFAVVADEVQRLAERSSAATKQIEALVKTIQTDTNEAVASMEQTTAEVVRGARLAQDAGVALEEIENVSTTLAELIQNISNAARQQASSAGHISNTMNVIQEITSQTSAGTNATARAIGHLAEMAVDLRDSVQGFKLPEEASSYADGAGMPLMGAEDERLSLD
ncbi:MAG TPA: methyl-accepting chemotaxis protein [Pseudomonadales bacterium]|nr:methyl-accepting chemotaxis protein [Pseudomonadales bacterium]